MVCALCVLMRMCVEVVNRIKNDTTYENNKHANSQRLPKKKEKLVIMRIKMK